MKKISVITICYNEKEVRQTCDSVVFQTYKDFEWIVIDGASEAWCLNILGEYRDKMADYVSEKDAGIYNAMNKGIGRATGEYLLFLNAGDSFCRSTVLSEASFYLNGVNDVCYADVQNVSPKGRSSLYQFPDVLPEDFFLRDCLNHQSTFIKRNLFDIHGMYNEAAKIVSDVEKCIIFKKAGCNFKHIPITCSRFCNNGASSNVRNFINEKERFLNPYFTCSELNSYNQYPSLSITRTYYLFGLIPVIKIKKKRHKRKLYVFGILVVSIK